MLYIQTKGATPFFVACQNGHLECVKELGKHNANHNTIRNTDGGVTPLMMASFNAHESIVKYLLSFADIDVLYRNKNNLTAFACAATSLNKDVCQLLYNHVMNKYLNNRQAPEVVTFVNQAESENGYTPLIIACTFEENKGLQLVQWLVNVCKVKIDCKNKDGQTAQQLAIQNGNDGIANWLATYIVHEQIDNDNK